MIVKKNYRLCISKGDGKPLTTEVAAKNGLEAVDRAKELYPGARTVHVLGISDTPPAVEHPFFGSLPVVTVDDEKNSAAYVKARQIEMCVKMRAEGKTHKAIAGYLGVGKTTVGNWLKQYG
jgi:hypothetical protein